MRHLKAGRRLGRTTSHRQALLRNLATSLLEHGRIETTEIKAKELRPYAERMITLGKRGDLHARRQALAFLRKKEVVSKVFTEHAEQFRDRQGGYTRILKVGRRHGDNSPMAIIELVSFDDKKSKEKGKSSTEGKAAKKQKDVKGQKKDKESKKSIKAPIDKKEGKEDREAKG